MKISTESLARASAIHPWRTILIWTVVLALSAVTVYALLGDGLTTEFTHSNNPDSKKADTMLEDRLRGPRRVKEVVIVASEDLVVEDAAFEVKVTELFEEIDALGSDVIQSGINYYMLPAPDLVSDDRHTTIMPLILAGSFDEAMKNVEQLNDVVADANGEGGFKVIIAGDASISLESNEISERDLRSVLVPASMRLLGDLNWYLPRILWWLPDFRVEPQEAVDMAVTDDYTGVDLGQGSPFQLKSNGRFFSPDSMPVIVYAMPGMWLGLRLAILSKRRYG